jgi:hypothetical protein
MLCGIAGCCWPTAVPHSPHPTISIIAIPRVVLIYISRQISGPSASSQNIHHGMGLGQPHGKSRSTAFPGADPAPRILAPPARGSAPTPPWIPYPPPGKETAAAWRTTRRPAAGRTISPDYVIVPLSPGRRGEQNIYRAAPGSKGTMCSPDCFTGTDKRRRDRRRRGRAKGEWGN